MSYLAQPTSKDGYGVVKIGDSINVDEYGVISAPAIKAGAGITVDRAPDSITISTSNTNVINVRCVLDNYTITPNDEYIGVRATNTVTITLPTKSVDGKIYIIKNEHGGGKIIIEPPVGTLIDGNHAIILTVPNQCMHIVFREGGWWII